MITSKKIRKEFQIIQNKCLKTILKVPLCTSTTLIHQTLKIDTIDQRIGNLTCNYLMKAKSNNNTIKEILDQHTRKPINFRKSKRSILDKIIFATLTPLLSSNN
jgi:transposase-like protein